MTGRDRPAQPDDAPASPAPADAPTGSAADRAVDPRVAAALGRLNDLATTPPAEHARLYEDVHSQLQDVLADSDRA